MAYDPIRFAREIVGRSDHVELLRCACVTAGQLSGQAAFAVYVPIGQTWERGIALAAARELAPATAAQRSALFAVHRRVAKAAGPLQLRRDPDCEPIFNALLPDAGALDAVPLYSGNGQMMGVIVTGADTRVGVDPARQQGDKPTIQQSDQPVAQQGNRPTSQLDVLTEIATLAGPALGAAWRYNYGRREQERLQLLSETTDAVLWDWDVVRNEMWWGGNLERLFGEVIVSKRPSWRHACVHNDDVIRVTESLQAAIEGQAPSWNEEYRLAGANGTIIEVREYAHFLREVNGKVYRVIGTVRDVSMLKQVLVRERHARADAERAGLAKDEFLAMLGHELRNPLAPILGALDILERRASGPDRPLEILRRQAQHLVRLVDDLLDVSRISSGKIELDRQHTGIEPLATRAVEMVLPLLEQRRHRIDLEIDAALVVDVDATRLTQVLANLIANAAKFTEPGGRIKVTAHAEGKQAVIAVADNGIGVAPEFLPHLFEMFTQGRQALDRAQGGLGLGLSIVKNIIKLHGGTVEARSEGQGHGTEIIFRLPLAAPQAGVATAPAPAKAEAQKSRRLLIVDDNEDAAELLSKLLAESGHSVRVAYHPHDALKLFEEENPDLALIDIGLPSMDGYELTRRMRAHPGGTDTKFVALTGYGQASDKTRATESGFHAHLVKPVSPERIEALIGELTG